MSRLIYSAIASVDGYIEDEEGAFGWAEPNEEVHAFVNELERPIGTYLYGRRLYETMAAWENEPSFAHQSPVLSDFAQVWQAAEKIVYSTTLESARTARTRIERRFDPAAVRALKEEADGDLAIGGPGLAAHAFGADLVDECRLFVVPIVVGGGKPALPRGVRLSLELIEQRGFGGGTVYLRYQTARRGSSTAPSPGALA